jgi:riboflavin transporter FmnP
MSDNRENATHPKNQIPAYRNTNRWETKELVTMALLCAISVLLSFIEIPLIPGVAWLKFDASAMPAMVVGFAYGGGAGIIVGIVSALIHGIVLGDWVGALMNIIVIIAMVGPASAVYRRMHSFKGAAVGLCLSVIVTVAAAIASNLVIDPFYFGMPFEAVAALVVPVLLPFNIVKTVLDSVLTLVVYKSISNLITPAKKQVRGR